MELQVAKPKPPTALPEYDTNPDQEDDPFDDSDSPAEDESK